MLLVAAVVAVSALGWLRAHSGSDRAVAVILELPDAPPMVMERDVINPIERRLVGVRGIARIEAVARRGTARVAVYPRSGAEVERALLDLAGPRAGQPTYSVGRVIRDTHESGPAFNAALTASAADSSAEPWKAPMAPMTLVGLLLLLIAGLTARWTRGAATDALAVVIAAVATVMVLRMYGFAVEASLLIALGVVLPLLIADAFIANASIVRHAELGGTAWMAVARGLRDAGPAMGASVAAGAILVGPLVLVAGYEPALATVVASLLVALVASVTVAIFVSSGAAVQHSRRTSPASPGAMQRLHARLDCWLDTITDGYHELLASLLTRRAVTTILVAAALFVSGGVVNAALKVNLTNRSDSSPSDVELVVSGGDARTLVGVAQRLSDDIRGVRGVVDVEFSAQALSNEAGPSQIEHVGSQRVTRVRANLEGVPHADAVRAIHDQLATVPLPPGYQATLGGDAVDAVRSHEQIGPALVVAVLAVWLLLAGHFRSMSEGTAVMLAMALPVGATVAVFAIARDQLDTWALVAAAGVAATFLKHAVVLVDFARARRSQTAPLRVALIEAARTTFRSIVSAALVASVLIVPVVAAATAAYAEALTLGVALAASVIVCGATVAVVLPAYVVWMDETKEAIQRRTAA